MRAAAWIRVAACAAGILGPGGAMAQRVLDFSELSGWAEDDHEEALAAFRETCGLMPANDWATRCDVAGMGVEARAFFETLFHPVLIEDGTPGLFTGYFEPEIPGSLTPDGRFRVPLYALPPEAPVGTPWLTRAEIVGGALAGRGLEIAWLEDPVDAFFLQVQGSGRLRLPDGGVMRLGYAGTNGHPYRSVAAELIARGTFEAHELSARTIRDWVRANPEEGAALLLTNPAYVFFRNVSEVPPEKGPLGAMNRSITPLRSLAVDPRYVPLGAPVWIETAGAEPLRRLMVAQDTGQAILGAQRGDIFFGTGAEAGERAGRVRDGGRLVVLVPNIRARGTLAQIVDAAAPPPGAE